MNVPPVVSICAVHALVLAFAGVLPAAPDATSSGTQPPSVSPTPTALKPLHSAELCNECHGTALPGRIMPHPEAKWGIISDLPESFDGYGCLYSTRDLLPENGAPEAMRRQVKGEAGAAAGFTAIDDSFDVFHFHLNKTAGATQRIVVFVRNLGKVPVTLKPAQVIKSEGIIGTVHDFESELGARVLRRNWDRPIASVAVPPGEGRVVAFGKIFGDGAQNAPDSSRNVNCFGYTRVLVEKGDDATTPALQVDVVAIPAVPRDQIQAEAGKWADRGVKSTDEVKVSQAPQGCALGRAVGTYPNFAWVSDQVVIDAAALPDTGTTFPIALPEVQTRGCPEARQTQDFALRPGYTRQDTIGNYMIENEVRFTFVNSSPKPRKVDVTFSKTSADIGLAYTVAEGGAQHRSMQVKTLWAGPKQAAIEKSLLTAPVAVEPGAARDLSLRFLVCGNSSLPFTLAVKSAK